MPPETLLTPSLARSIQSFHHVEFVCADATSTAEQLRHALGMRRIASVIGDHVCAHALASGDVRFVVASPKSSSEERSRSLPSVTLSPKAMEAHVARHGLAVHAVCVETLDAATAFEQALSRGAVAKTPPTSSTDHPEVVISEVFLHGEGTDCALRFISGTSNRVHFLPGFTEVSEDDAEAGTLFSRTDHVVSNVPDLGAAVDYVQKVLGFHEFAEFTSEDVGTVDSGLNSIVLANDSEHVLLPFNEPTTGTRRKSQIQTYLDQHGGPGVQHIALKTDDIFATVAFMRDRGVDFMDRPRREYYAELPKRIPELTPAQAKTSEALGILVDADKEGMLLQIFTKPLGAEWGGRGVFFFEVIQRVGCDKDAEGKTVAQRPGCGGFGKGNFRELFRAVEDHETKLGLNK